MPWKNVSDSYRGRYALCIATLAVSCIALPLLALLVPRVPRPLGNALFFWPQYLLLPAGLERPSSALGAERVFAMAPVLAAAFWLVAVGLFVYGTLGWRARWMMAALFPAVALTVVAALVVLDAFGLAPVLDGL